MLLDTAAGPFLLPFFFVAICQCVAAVSRSRRARYNSGNMPFDLPEGYLLGLCAWLAAGTVLFVALLGLRRRARGKRAVVWRLANASLAVLVFLAAMTVVE